MGFVHKFFLFNKKHHLAKKVMDAVNGTGSAAKQALIFVLLVTLIQMDDSGLRCYEHWLAQLVGMLRSSG